MTFVCSGQPGYSWKSVVQKMSAERYAAFRVETGCAELPEGNTEEALKSVYLHDTMMDDEQVRAWMDAGVEITMHRLRGLASNSRDLAQTIYQISVPSVGLLQIQSVRVLEDCCTDALQDELRAGWRILAVCPPNDTRRPSYVLGHAEVRP